MILERIQGERWSRILPVWKGQTVAILAGGPSLTAAAFARVRAEREADRLRVIAINDSYLLAPWADLHYAADAKWHRWHTEGVDKPALGLRADEVRARWAAFMGQKSTIQSAAEHVPDAVHVLRNLYEPHSRHGLSQDPRLIAGTHGGMHMINAAILAGASRLLLLGYDAHSGEHGRHWHGEHPNNTDGARSNFDNILDSFRLTQNAIAEAGVEVINCSLSSRIETFPKRAIEEALA